jgi:DNA polymerase III subunit delta
MPAVTEAKLFEHLAARPARAAIFLHGPEEFLRTEAVRRILAEVLDPATRDFNLDQRRGADLTAEELASLLATPPMMAERRVVLVRDAQGLSPKAREVVESVVAQPPAGLVLVLTATIPSGSKAKFYNTLQRQAWSVEFAPVDAMDLPGWLSDRARTDHGVTLELDAARAMVAALGNDVGILMSEMEKLVSFAAGRDRLTLEDVRAVCGFIPQVDRWEWFDLIGTRRFAEALRRLPDLLRSGESGVALVIGMTTQMLRIGLVAEGGKDALERQLQPYQRWLAGRVVPQARAWTVPEVDTALRELVRTDRLLKTAPLTDRQAMEELLLRLLHALPDRRSAA